MRTIDNERQRAFARARSQSNRWGTVMIVEHVIKRPKKRYL